MDLIIAGYTASPTDPTDAKLYYQQLTRTPRANGLELAWKGDAPTRTEIATVQEALPADWLLTINATPGIFRAWADDHHVGLASPDDEGRAKAVAMVADMAAVAQEVNAAARRPALLAIEVQCGPGFSDRVVTPDAGALGASLRELADLDFGGASLLIEHCDKFIEGQVPAKGFLALEDELEALASLPETPIGLSLNWGRSVIELRDPERVVDHIRLARESGLLRAFTLSGSAAQDNAVGVAWADSHLAFADPLDGQYGEPASLMTKSYALQSLNKLDDLLFLAVKTNWPAPRKDPLERARSVAANFATAVELLDNSKNP